jgi:HK97 family phage major capsid protein
MATYKGEEINTKPTEAMANNAKRGLEWREEFGRGGTEVGVARARDLINRRDLSINTVRRMYSYFARHTVDKQAEGFSSGEEGFPSAGRIAWELWGGDAGESWANRITQRLNSLDERAYEDKRPYPNEHAARIREPGQYEQFRRINDELGEGIDIIVGYKDGETEIQSIRFDSSQFSEDEAREWLRENNWEVLEFEPAIEERAMETEKRAEPDELSVGDFVSWNSSGGRARGKIERIERDGSINVPDSDFTVNGTEEDPAALIRVYDSEGNESDVRVGHRFSTLTKIDPIRGYDEEERHIKNVTETADSVIIEFGKSEDDAEEEEAEERKGSVEITHRAMELSAKAVDEESRRVKMAVSSEEPVQRSFGMEVLEHSEEAIDLSFLNSGRAPLLLDHDPERQIGVVESVDLDGSARRLRATVRFGKGALAREAFDDVVDGIKANVSIGYAINKLERKDKDTYVAKSWRPVEASLVSIPADASVGVGRSGSASSQPVIKTDFKEIPMSESIDIAAVEADARKAAQKNAAQIVELGARHSKSDLAQRAISEGKSIEEFRGELLEVIGSDRSLESQEIGLNKKEAQRFSLVRAVHAMANPTDRRAQEAAAFEFECSRAAADQYGKSAQGIMLPADVLRNWTRDLNSADEAELFTDDFRGGEFIDVLRNASSVMQAGARMLGGLSGDVKIPKKTTAASAGWIATEGGASAESEMVVGQVSMTPKTLGAHTDVTRQLLIQSSMDVEAMMRDDLAQAIATAIDLAGLEGSGSSGQPTGILNTSGVNTVTAFAAANPTFAEVVTLETAVAEDNALTGNLAYILPASMYGALKTTEKASGTAQFVVEPGGSINGYRGIVSNQCTAGNLYFGNFADLLVGMFGGLDIVVDPYTNSTSGTVRVVALQSVDVAVRHAVSFAFGNDG